MKRDLWWLITDGDERIFAVGDVVGVLCWPYCEGKIAAEVISRLSVGLRCLRNAGGGLRSADHWCGMTEEQARAQTGTLKSKRFPGSFPAGRPPWGAPEGLTKIIVEPQTGRIIGVGIAVIRRAYFRRRAGD